MLSPQTFPQEVCYSDAKLDNHHQKVTKSILPHLALGHRLSTFVLADAITQYIHYIGGVQIFLDTSNSTAQPQQTGLSQTKDPAQVCWAVKLTVKACFSAAVTRRHRAVCKLVQDRSLLGKSMAFLPRLPKVLISRSPRI